MKKNSIIWMIIAIVVLVTATVLMWVFGPNIWPDWENTMYGHMIGGWAMPFGMLGVGIFWLVIIYFVIRGFSQESHHHDREQNALEILNKRLANGEISVEEYEEIRSKIKGV